MLDAVLHCGGGSPNDRLELLCTYYKQCWPHLFLFLLVLCFCFANFRLIDDAAKQHETNERNGRGVWTITKSIFNRNDKALLRWKNTPGNDGDRFDILIMTAMGRLTGFRADKKILSAGNIVVVFYLLCTAIVATFTMEYRKSRRINHHQHRWAKCVLCVSFVPPTRTSTNDRLSRWTISLDKCRRTYSDRRRRRRCLCAAIIHLVELMLKFFSDFGVNYAF